MNLQKSGNQEIEATKSKHNHLPGSWLVGEEEEVKARFE